MGRMGLEVAGTVLKHKKPGGPNHRNDLQGNRSNEAKRALPLVGFSKEGSPEKEKLECLFKMQISVPHLMALN